MLYLSNDQIIKEQRNQNDNYSHSLRNILVLDKTMQV